MRMVSSPLAPARRTRAASSSTNLAVPRAGVGPAAALAGVQHLAGVGAAGNKRVVAEGVGVAVGGALLVDQGQQLAAGPVRAGPLTQVDQRIRGLLDAQPLGQRGRQEQPCVGDGVGVVEVDVELVEGVGVGDPIEKVPS
jgi:hypothetical protein